MTPRKAEHPLRTPEEIRAAFEAEGRSISQWAREHGLRPAIVYQVLSGAKKGRRGDSHRAAVLLGLKHGIVTRREPA
jgi:gp16 family phage-associated protein